MKKLICKAMLYFAAMAAFVFVMNSIVSNPYEQQKGMIEKIINNPQDYQSFAFGRSHAGSLDYEFYDKKGVNFALGGRDLASVKYLLEFLTPKCDSLKEVVLFLSYSSLYFDNTAMSSGNLNDARKALYYSVPSYSIIGVDDLNNFVFGKMLPFVQADHGYTMMKNLRNWGGGQNTDNQVVIEPPVMNNDEMAASGEKQSQRDIQDKRASLSYNSNIAEQNENLLYEIADICKQNNINLILIQAPYHNAYVKNVPQDMKQELSAFAEKLADDCELKYMDFSEDERFAYDNSLYMNSDHLNNKGKELFTNILKNTY